MVCHWPLVWAVIILVNFRIGFAAGMGPHSLAGFPSWLSAGLMVRLAVVLVLLLACPRIPVLGLVTAACLLALASGYQFHTGYNAAAVHGIQPPWAFMARPSWRGDAVLRVTGWPSAARGGGWSFPAVLVAVGTGASEGDSRFPQSHDGVLLTTEEVAPQPGALLVCRVELRPPTRASLPGGFRDDIYLAGRHLAWRGYVKDQLPVVEDSRPLFGVWLSSLHRGIVNRLQSILPPVEADLAAAVLLGVKSPISRLGSRPFAKLGLAHLFALSGLHVGILLGILLLPGRMAGWGPGWRLLPVIMVLPVYVILTGAPGSVLRAVGMVCLVLGGPWLGRRGNVLRQLGLLYLVAVIWDPWQLLDMGVQLSFLAAGGILAVGQLTRGFQVAARFPVPLIVAGLGVSLSAQWFTLPVVAAGFGFLNLWSPVANLFIVPLFGLAVWLTVLALASSCWGWLSGSVAAWAIVCWRAMLLAVNPASSYGARFALHLMPPTWACWIIWATATAALLLALQRLAQGRIRPSVAWPCLGLGMIGVLYLFAHQGRDLNPASAPVSWQVDVGQGDCACLAFPDGWRCVIDTGGRFGARGPQDAFWGRTLGPYLARQGIGYLDLVILTHGHLDHTGGAVLLAQVLKVGAWLCGGTAHAPSSGPARGVVMAATPGQVLHRWHQWTLTLLQAPDPADQSLGENDHSLMVALNRNDAVIMVWGGDQELAAERMFARGQPDFGPTMVFKAGHHGSNTSGGLPFLTMLHPRLCLVSCGAGNKYRHPSHGPYVVGQDTLPVVRTDTGGSIRLTWDKRGGLTWRSLYGGQGKVPPP